MWDSRWIALDLRRGLRASRATIRATTGPRPRDRDYSSPPSETRIPRSSSAPAPSSAWSAAPLLIRSAAMAAASSSTRSESKASSMSPLVTKWRSARVVATGGAHAGTVRAHLFPEGDDRRLLGRGNDSRTANDRLFRTAHVAHTDFVSPLLWTGAVVSSSGTPEPSGPRTPVRADI